MISEAIRETFLGLAEADKSTRVPARCLISTWPQCGGSDGFSGLSRPAIDTPLTSVVALVGGNSFRNSPNSAVPSRS